jgi:hypothetical protein
MTKLVPIPNAKPGEIQVKADDKPEKLTALRITREVRESAYLSLRILGNVEWMVEVGKKSPADFLRFLQSILVKDPDDGAAGVNIIVQQIVMAPTPTRGVGGSPVVGDVEVLGG